MLIIKVAMYLDVENTNTKYRPLSVAQWLFTSHTFLNVGSRSLRLECITILHLPFALFTHWLIDDESIERLLALSGFSPFELKFNIVYFQQADIDEVRFVMFDQSTLKRDFAWM